MKRDQYGAISAQEANVFEAGLFKSAKELLNTAAKAKLICCEYENMTWTRISARKGSKKIGNGVNHDIYDITADARYVLVCVRAVEGTEYGIATRSKTYFLVTPFRKSAKVFEVPKHAPAKAAKASALKFGAAIESCLSAMTLTDTEKSAILKSCRKLDPVAQAQEMEKKIARKIERELKKAKALGVVPNEEAMLPVRSRVL